MVVDCGGMDSIWSMRWVCLCGLGLWRDGLSLVYEVGLPLWFGIVEGWTLSGL